MGLEVAVGVGVSIGIAQSGVDIIPSVEVTTSVALGWTSTAGLSNTEERTYSATPTIMVPPLSTATAVISGNVVKVDIPYTADQVTIYKDGTRSTATPISGVYTGVETGRFTITYEEPIGRSNARES